MKTTCSPERETTPASRLHLNACGAQDRASQNGNPERDSYFDWPILMLRTPLADRWSGPKFPLVDV
jgi:hypothetical protein